MAVIPIKPEKPDPLDDFCDLFEDVKRASDHELQLSIGAVKPPELPWRRNHPVTDQFPSLEGADYAKLKEDIRANGQKKAICMYQGMIWDGRARYDACVDLGLKPRVWILRRGDPIIYLLHRHGDRYGRPSTPERQAALTLLRKLDSPEWKAESLKRRTEWIADARAEFDKQWRAPKTCAICGLSAEYSHKHHSFPLNLQYALGVDEPVQEHDWLCPVHHKFIHQEISARLIGSRWNGGADFHYRYKDPEARTAAKVAADKIFLKAQNLFLDAGGVPASGNYSMLAP